MSIEVASIHWNASDGSKYRVEFIKGPLDSAEIEEVRLRAFEIHRQGLKYNPFLTVEQLTRNMQAGRDGSIYFASTLDGQDVGYVSQRVMLIRPEDYLAVTKDLRIEIVEGLDETIRALFVTTKVFLEEHQGKGLGRLFAEQANLMHRPDIFTGRSQNPYVYLSHRRTRLFSKLYPIDEEFGDSTVELNPRQVVLAVIGRKTNNPGVNLRTGIVKGAYPKGTERAFILNPENTEAVEIYEVLKNRGLDFANGDAALYIAPKEAIRPQIGRILLAA